MKSSHPQKVTRCGKNASSDDQCANNQIRLRPGQCRVAMLAGVPPVNENLGRYFSIPCAPVDRTVLLSLESVKLPG